MRSFKITNNNQKLYDLIRNHDAIITKRRKPTKNSFRDWI